MDFASLAAISLSNVLKRRLKVACMSEIIDKNIFRERNTLYTNSKTNNTKAIDNYRDDQLITI